MIEYFMLSFEISRKCTKILFKKKNGSMSTNRLRAEIVAHFKKSLF